MKILPVKFITRWYSSLRGSAGQDAYERYLAHWREHHGAERGEPLSRGAFFKQELEHKWSGVKRCC